MKTLIFLFLLTNIAISAVSQKKELITEKEAIITEAKKELDETIKNPESKLMLLVKENKVTGEFIFDITIHGKGEVLSVFVVSSDADDVKMQNMVKDWVKALEFNFKMPKDKSFKFQYTFNF